MIKPQRFNSPETGNNNKKARTLTAEDLRPWQFSLRKDPAGPGRSRPVPGSRLTNQFAPSLPCCTKTVPHRLSTSQVEHAARGELCIMQPHNPCRSYPTLDAFGGVWANLSYVDVANCFCTYAKYVFSKHAFAKLTRNPQKSHWGSQF